MSTEALLALIISLLWVFFLYVVVTPRVLSFRRAIKVKSCACGAHWWIRCWPFWRHLDASPFNDQLQDRWTIWLFEFNDYLVISVPEQEKMGYPEGPIWEDGSTMWKRSKRQLSISHASYCVRCASHGL